MRRFEDMTEPELRDLLNALARELEATAKAHGVERPHFCLLVFDDPKVAQYVANCRREDVIDAMRECADRLEGRQDVER